MNQEQEQNQQQEPTLEQQLAEAEQRGYLRGLNEQIDRDMERPGVWERSSTPHQPEVLSQMSRSIWQQ